MSCLHPMTIINRRYASMSAVELAQYCKEHLVYNETYFVTDRDVRLNADSGFSTSALPKFLPIDYAVTIPCGKCMNCRTAIRNAWVGRLAAELVTSRMSGYSPTFVTLTFDDEHLPPTTKDCYPYLNKFMDRFRKRYGFRPRYAFATDVSPSGRLHFHGIIYNTTRESITYEGIRSCWFEGYSWTRGVTLESARYVCKYIMKDPPLEEHIVYDKTIHKTRMFTSNGVGLSYAQSMAEGLDFSIDGVIPDFCVTVGGKRFPVHPYLRSKILTDDLRLKLRLCRMNLADFPRMFAGKEIPDYETLIRVWDELIKAELRADPGLKERLSQGKELFRQCTSEDIRKNAIPFLRGDDYIPEYDLDLTTDYFSTSGLSPSDCAEVPIFLINHLNP